MSRPALPLALACLLALVCSWPVLAPEPQAPDTFAPVAFQCWTGPRVYCAPDMSACWSERDFYWSWSPCDLEPDPVGI